MTEFFANFMMPRYAWHSVHIALLLSYCTFRRLAGDFYIGHQGGREGESGKLQLLSAG